MTIAEQLHARGLEQGLQQGRRQVLEKLLGWKFNPLPPAVLERVQAADADQLDRWLERVLTADSLEGVFDA